MASIAPNNKFIHLIQFLRAFEGTDLEGVGSPGSFDVGQDFMSGIYFSLADPDSS